MVATPSTSAPAKGVVRQVIGPVLDVEFPAGNCLLYTSDAADE